MYIYLFARLAQAPFEGRSQSDAAGPGLAIHPPLLYVGYVGFSIVVLVRRRRADRGPDRRRLGALGAALDAGGLDVPDARHRDGLLLGLLRTRLGRLVVLGSGRERLLHAVARRHRAAALGRRHGEARRAEGLDDPARDPHLLALAARHLPGALGRADLRARLRQSIPTRGVFILGILVLFIGGALALFAWRAPMLRQGGLFAPISREGALVLNNLFLADRLRDRVRRHALSAGARGADRREDLGRRAVLQRDLRPAVHAAAAGRCRSGRCWPGSAATCSAWRSGCRRPSRSRWSASRSPSP